MLDKKKQKSSDNTQPERKRENPTKGDLAEPRPKGFAGLLTQLVDEEEALRLQKLGYTVDHSKEPTELLGLMPVPRSRKSNKRSKKKSP